MYGRERSFSFGAPVGGVGPIRSASPYSSSITTGSSASPNGASNAQPLSYAMQSHIGGVVLGPSGQISTNSSTPLSSTVLFQGVQRGRSVSQPVPFQRSVHSMTEKRRRDRMNGALDTLRSVVPGCQSREINKIDVLLETITYINHLHLLFGVDSTTPRLSPVTSQPHDPYTIGLSGNTSLQSISSPTTTATKVSTPLFSERLHGHTQASIAYQPNNAAMRSSTHNYSTTVASPQKYIPKMTDIDMSHISPNSNNHIAYDLPGVLFDGSNRHTIHSDDIHASVIALGKSPSIPFIQERDRSPTVGVNGTYPIPLFNNKPPLPPHLRQQYHLGVTASAADGQPVQLPSISSLVDLTAISDPRWMHTQISPSLIHRTPAPCLNTERLDRRFPLLQ